MATGREVLRLVGASATLIDGKLVKRPEPEDVMGSQDAPENSCSTGLDYCSSVKAARMTLQPGWRWSECIKPVVGTESCQTHHVGTVASGQLQVRHDDGTEVQVGPGDAYVIDPGHDAWVIGSEPFVAYEFDSSAAETYARG
jgi:mannose-6-phosphate isomerase-like protein (cupin superfamily)